MKVTILGTGSPEGHPIILHPDDYVEGDESRLRPGLLIEDNDIVLFDINPDIRLQLLKLRIKSLNAIFVTHQHFDHLWGIGDLFQLTWLGKINFTIYTNNDTKNYINKYFPWINLNFEIFEYDKTYVFRNFTVTPKKAMHSIKFDTAVFETKIGSKNILYAPDFKGFMDEKYVKDYDFAVIDGAYYFGKYIEDDDHLGGKDLEKLINKTSAKINYLIGVSPYWYRQLSSELLTKLPTNILLPKDFEQIKI